VNAAQKKKLMMVVLMVAAVGLVGYQLAPMFGFGGGSSGKKSSKKSSAAKRKPGEKICRVAGGKTSRVAGGKTSRVAGGKPSRVAGGKPSRVAGGTRRAVRQAPRRAASGNAELGPEGSEGRESPYQAGRTVSPRELVELLNDSDFVYDSDGLRDPAVDLLLAAQAKREQEAAQKPYRPNAKLEGILWNEARPLVIIEGKIYEEGQIFDGKGRIVEIHPTHIVVGHGFEKFGVLVSSLYGAPVTALPHELHASQFATPENDPLIFRLDTAQEAVLSHDEGGPPWSIP